MKVKLLFLFLFIIYISRRVQNIFDLTPLYSKRLKIIPLVVQIPKSQLCNELTFLLKPLMRNWYRLKRTRLLLFVYLCSISLYKSQKIILNMQILIFSDEGNLEKETDLLIDSGNYPANICWSSRRLQNVSSVTIFCLPRQRFWGRLKDALKTSWKTKNCYAENVFKTSLRHVFKTSASLLMGMFTGNICI